MKKYLFLLPLLTLLIFAKCPPSKSTTNNPPEVLEGVSEASALLDFVEATNTPYTWYAASGTGTIDWDDQRLSAKLNIRIRKDSVIWAQISKLGFEVGRMLVTPDSAYFINRIEQKYGRYSTREFFKKYKLPGDFSMFSKVFTGGAFIPNDVKNMWIESGGALFLESASGINARHWLDVSYRLISSHVIDPNKNIWNAGYGDYRTVNTGQIFPFVRSNTLTINGVDNLFDMEYSSVIINVPQELPFSIPSHYEKM